MFLFIVTLILYMGTVNRVRQESGKWRGKEKAAQTQERVEKGMESK